MSETKIEMKIDEEIKPLKELCEKMVKMVCAEVEKGAENIDTHEMYEVADIIKDLSEAKKNTVEACYKKYILGVMEENEDEYDETWDEDGPIMRKGYRGQPRSKTSGRYMSRYDGRRSGYSENPYDHDDMMMPEIRRDMDREYGKMYYTENRSSNNSMMNDNSSMRGNARDSREGRSGMSRRNYMETKELHKGNTPEDKQAKVRELDKYMNDFGSDIKEMVHDMTPEEKTMMRTKMQNIINAL